MGRGGADAAGDGVGNVTEFEVEEDGLAARGELLNDPRAGRGEELHADLEPGADAVEAMDEFEGGGFVGDIEGDDEAFASLVEWAGRGCGGDVRVQVLRDGHIWIVTDSSVDA